MFAIGCVVSETYLHHSLFPGICSSEREHLAIVERVVGAFPLEFARAMEAKFPGTFQVGRDLASVIFPVMGSVDAVDRMAACRVQTTKHVAVRYLTLYHSYKF